MSYVKRIIKLYDESKVDDTTMVKMAVFREKVAELIKEGIGIDKKHLLLGAAMMAGAGVGAAAIETVSDYFLSRRARQHLEEDTQKVFDEIYSSPEVSKYPKEEALKYFQTLKHFSPHIATDPLSAKTYLLQMLDWYDESSAPISPTSVRDLAEIEAKAMDALAKRPISDFDIGRFTEPITSTITKEPKHLFSKYWDPTKED
jgi:hypothetical protein